MTPSSVARRLGLGALALALPLAASAQEAYTRGVLNLRAGPGPEYPVVARLAGGQPLNVVGCTGGYAWCDVVLPDGLRGWAAASRLDYAWGGNVVPLVGYGAAIGIPIIGFSIGSYWNDYYRDRPWFREPRWWGNRPPPPPVPGWRPAPPPSIGWQPRPPAPGWRPPPGAQRPGVPPPAARPPGWNSRPGRPEGPRPPQWGGPGPGGGRPMPMPTPAPHGTTRPSAGQHTPPGDRP